MPGNHHPNTNEAITNRGHTNTTNNMPRAYQHTRAGCLVSLEGIRLVDTQNGEQTSTCMYIYVHTNKIKHKRAIHLTQTNRGWGAHTPAGDGVGEAHPGLDREHEQACRRLPTCRTWRRRRSLRRRSSRRTHGHHSCLLLFPFLCLHLCLELQLQVGTVSRYRGCRCRRHRLKRVGWPHCCDHFELREGRGGRRGGRATVAAVWGGHREPRHSAARVSTGLGRPPGRQGQQRRRWRWGRGSLRFRLVAFKLGPSRGSIDSLVGGAFRGGGVRREQGEGGHGR